MFLRHVDDVNLINDRAPLVFADVMRVALQTTHLQTMRRGSTGRLPTTSLLRLPPLYSVVSALEVVVILAGPVQPYVAYHSFNGFIIPPQQFSCLSLPGGICQEGPERCLA